ncbi:hypothetical protein UFOVP909_106 [uncultured Caudovirales phage]|uniref:Uncharacterized protein n=1 Tax=uncultured Caudovirales phage TaxID=2100421 RepID=A0A6J5PFJ7_9CAUD|nr:hypothetical protein UFOVP909_106 [uncultured Caudovirales phage]CAB4182178.1 hypothetical protein UFOVP1066_165 [uncultured Caudovirales phage]CAB4198606.1 hypothetical protein UFOVP1315_172 [uncultured Caudovirales phage]CAB4211526.1 hypothetical protein UFOVP1421_133 [uncultured Caudovirales phage]CAB5238639.1 hypothetical protein UFOVP1525_143 [uncultured Caudovirales phage]
MGKTYNKQKTDNEFSGKRSGKSTGKNGGGMKTLNSYVEEELDFDDDIFNDDIEMTDDIQIQHIQNDNTN